MNSILDNSRVGASVYEHNLEAFLNPFFGNVVTTFTCSHCQSVSHGVVSRLRFFLEIFLLLN